MKLRSVCGELHVFDGSINWQPLRIAVEIDPLGTIRCCEGMGGSIEIDRAKLQSALLEHNSVIEVHDLTDRIEPSLRSSEVGMPRLLYHRMHGTIGIAIPRLGRRPLCLWARDGEFYWGEYEEMATSLGARYVGVGAPLKEGALR